MMEYFSDNGYGQPEAGMGDGEACLEHKEKKES